MAITDNIYTAKTARARNNITATTPVAITNGVNLLNINTQGEECLIHFDTSSVACTTNNADNNLSGREDIWINPWFTYFSICKTDGTAPTGTFVIQK